MGFFARLALCLAVAISASAQGVTPGTLQERVAVAENSAQSYALYLPKGYTPQARWPVVFVLDPAARGALAARQFQDAADSWGYVVAASNNSRNGSARDSLLALSALQNDIGLKASIDFERQYVAGFSGGARVAFGALQICPKCFAGMIGSGAGFNFEKKIPEPFTWYGIVGREDFNYGDVVDAEATCVRAGADCHVELFDGGHDWATAETLTHALGWLTLRAMSQGKLAKDATIVDRLWTERLQSAGAQSHSDPMQALREYESLVRDFHGLRDVLEAKQAAESLAASKSVRDARKRSDQIQKVFNIRSSEFTRAMEGLRARGEERSTAIADLQLIIKRIQGEVDSKDASEALIARRLRGYMRVMMWQTALKWTEEKAFSDLVTLHELQTKAFPDDSSAWARLAFTHAQLKHPKPAVEALTKALELGVPRSVLEDERLRPVRDTEEFQRLKSK